MRGFTKSIIGLTGIAIAAAGLSVPAAAQDSFKDWQAYQYLKVDTSTAVVWTSAARTYEVSFREPCEAMFTKAAKRTRIAGGTFNRVRGQSRDRMTFGYTSCYIDNVKRVDMTQVASLMADRQLAEADIVTLETGLGR